MEDLNDILAIMTISNKSDLDYVNKATFLHGSSVEAGLRAQRNDLLQYMWAAPVYGTLLKESLGL